MSESTIIIIFSILKSELWEVFHFFTENPYHFHNNTQFFSFAHITKSSFFHVFVTNTAFVTFKDIENNQEYEPKHNFIIIELYNFC